MLRPFLVVTCILLYSGLSFWIGRHASLYNTPLNLSWLDLTKNLSFFVPSGKTSILEPFGSDCPQGSLLVVVISAVSHFKARKAIRETWGSAFQNQPLTHVLFFLGATTNHQLQDKVRAEQSQHHDLLQEDFVDSYVNLTLKTAFLMKWLDSWPCIGFQYVFKVDEDNFVNPQNLLELVHETPLSLTKDEREYLILGRVQFDIPFRGSNPKYQVPRKVHPQWYFPLYIGGDGVIFTRNIAKDIFQCASGSKYMNMEDVLHFGTCANQKLGLHLTFSFSFIQARPFFMEDHPCYARAMAKIHSYSKEELMPMWKLFQDQKLPSENCQESWSFWGIWLLNEGLFYFERFNIIAVAAASQFLLEEDIPTLTL